jgi:hypothetical protein
MVPNLNQYTPMKTPMLLSIQTCQTRLSRAEYHFSWQQSQWVCRGQQSQRVLSMGLALLCNPFFATLWVTFLLPLHHLFVTTPPPRRHLFTIIPLARQHFLSPLQLYPDTQNQLKSISKKAASTAQPVVLRVSPDLCRRSEAG